MFQKLGPAVDMAEFAVGAESLHQALHRAAIINGPEMGVISALRPIEPGEIMAEQLLAFGGSENDVRIEEQRRQVVGGEPGSQTLKIDQANFAIANDHVL